MNPFCVPFATTNMGSAMLAMDLVCCKLLWLKAILEIAQEQPKQALETYKILLALVQSQTELQAPNSSEEVNLETWPDADICIGKTKATNIFNSRGWHTKGKSFEAQEQYKEALVAFSVSLSIEPDYVPSIVSSAGVLIKLGRQNLPIARNLLMTALRLEPTNHHAWFLLGVLSKSQGLKQAAVDYFQAVHELKLSAPVQDFA
ncbi:unnamed protein product [Coffea canephora]|uniref:Uncharacterized protein n=1 Tax=Coffea canephora TaxID=49390 RepID=A0A068VBE3_COFCA|nr:unnamed protein product [Coffea canephora]